MKAAIAVIVVLIIIAAIFGSMYVGRKNQMVTLDEQVKSNWSQVDVQLQRRAEPSPGALGQALRHQIEIAQRGRRPLTPGLGQVHVVLVGLVQH